MLQDEMGGGAGRSGSCGWLRGERRECYNKVFTHPAGFSGFGLATQRGLHGNGELTMSLIG